MQPPLHGLINFGWLEFIAEPLFHGLKWLHSYVSNWGWAIVVLTLVINMLLFPLRISSYKTTLKMQRVAPEIKAIRSEEHTSELQSHLNLVCRLLLEKKKMNPNIKTG